MAFMMLEDYTSKSEIVIFSKLYNRVQSWIKEYSVFIVKGIPDNQADQLCKIKATDLIPIDLIISEGNSITNVTLIVPDSLNPSSLNGLKEHLVTGTIPLMLSFQENGQNLQIASKTKITITPQFMEQIKNIGLQIKLSL